MEQTELEQIIEQARIGAVVSERSRTVPTLHDIRPLIVLTYLIRSV
jgi:hypothetical protein